MSDAEKLHWLTIALYWHIATVVVLATATLLAEHPLAVNLCILIAFGTLGGLIYAIRRVGNDLHAKLRRAGGGVGSD